MGTVRRWIAAIALMAIAMLVAVGAAWASPPSWHACVKAKPKSTGNYADKLCSVEAEPGKGAYELVEGVGKGKAFKGKAGPSNNSLRINIPLKAEVSLVCQKATMTGRPVAPRGVAGVTITFSKCEMEGFQCPAISTAQLGGELGWIDKASGIAGVSLASEASPGSGVIAEFKCGSVAAARVTGAVIGEMVATATVDRAFTLRYAFGLGTPETNPAEFEEGFVGTLKTEFFFEGSWTPEGGNVTGSEELYNVKGEPLAVF